MLIPERFSKRFLSDQAWRDNIENFPLFFFGGFIQYPKQAHIIKTWLEKQPKITVITGWKRTGKTTLAAYLGSCWLMGECDPDWAGAKAMGIARLYKWKKMFGSDRTMVIGGKSMDHVESVLLKEYRGLLPPSYVRDWFSRSKHNFSMADETRAVIRTYDQDLETWKSGQASLIHLDEAPPRNVLDECLERTRTTKGKIIISVAIDDADESYLPDACLNPLKYFGTADFLHFKLGVEDVPTEMYPEEEKSIVYQQYDNTPLAMAVRKGDFAYIGGRWWKNWDPGVHVIPQFKIPEHWERWRWIDPGIAAPTACIWTALHPKGDALFVYREYYKAGTTIDERCRDIIELSGNHRQRDGDRWVEHQSKERYLSSFMDHAEFKQDTITGDGLEQFYFNSGLEVLPWTTLGQEARREVINKWLALDMSKQHFSTHEKGAPRIYVFDACTNLIWEANKKTVKKSTERGSTLEKKIMNKDDHLLDALESAACELSYWVKDAAFLET